LTARYLRRNEVMRVQFRLGALWMPRASVIFDNLVVMQFCAHDVAVACCLAMAEVWVRLPLGAFTFRWVLCWYGRATVNRLVAGSIPAAGAFVLQVPNSLRRVDATWAFEARRSGAIPGRSAD